MPRSRMPNKEISKWNDLNRQERIFTINLIVQNLNKIGLFKKSHIIRSYNKGFTNQYFQNSAFFLQIPSSYVASVSLNSENTILFGNYVVSRKCKMCIYINTQQSKVHAPINDFHIF